MKWRCRRVGTKERALSMWHDWFAWFPVRVPDRVGKHRVWLETIRRRFDISHGMEGPYYDARYKERV